MVWLRSVQMQQRIQPPMLEHLAITMMDFGEGSQMTQPSKDTDPNYVINPIWGFVVRAIESGNESWIQEVCSIIDHTRIKLDEVEEHWQSCEDIKRALRKDE